MAEPVSFQSSCEDETHEHVCRYVDPETGLRVWSCAATGRAWTVPPSHRAFAITHSFGEPGVRFEWR